LSVDFVREMEFDKASLEVEARYRRCAVQWGPHLERTRTAILFAARMARNRRKAVVMGAGLLHDIPLVELAGLFEEVVLVDVVHSRPCLLRASIFSNVRCLQADVTGTALHLLQARKTGGPLPRIEPDLFQQDATVDFTVSVNLLSQIGCAPSTFLAASHPREEIRAFQRQLIEAHLGYLRRCAGHSALITDFAWSNRKANQPSAPLTNRRDVLHQAVLPRPAETWEWLIAPAPESDLDADVIAQVAAYPDWKEASRIRA
jgi:hypothetical protein